MTIHLGKVEVDKLRRAHAIEQAEMIRNTLRAVEVDMWRKAAEQAKEKGLYAKTTYIGDVANGLKSHAGLRYRGLVQQEEVK